MKEIRHYKKDGTLYKGTTHKMPKGILHTGKMHGKSSKKLFTFGGLSVKSKVKAKSYKS